MLQEITTTTSYYRHATYSFASLIYIYYFHGVCIKSELLGQDGITRGVKVKSYFCVSILYHKRLTLSPIDAYYATIVTLTNSPDAEAVPNASLAIISSSV